MPQPAYILAMPKTRSTATIFASPHSGRDYPWRFLRDSGLDEAAIRSSEDAFVDRLFDAAPEFGAPLLSATMPRAFVDLNRAADELDPALIDGARLVGRNLRIASGLGVIPRVVARGREIRDGKISMNEARRRLNDYYHPYHARLGQLVAENQAKFGLSLLFDCHSMPHESLAEISGEKPEIVLGNRFGATSAPQFMDEVEGTFLAAGLRVSRNLPFAGAFVTRHYGKPDQGSHAIQIEIDRAIYMDEAKVTPNDNFAAFQRLMHDVTRRLAQLGQEDIQLAAQ